MDQASPNIPTGNPAKRPMTGHGRLFGALGLALLFLSACSSQSDLAPSSENLDLASLNPTTPGSCREARAAAQRQGLRGSVLDLAQRIHACALRRGEVTGSVLTVIDYSLPSTEPRLWVLDTERDELLFSELVAHGSGSGELNAVDFSNRSGTHATSLGLFRTGEVYFGKHGRSMRLQGLDRDINDQAEARAIVVHAAEYVSNEFVEKNGRLGRSWGCPALNPEISDAVIDNIVGGTAVVAYYPDPNWLGRSSYVHCDAEVTDQGSETFSVPGKLTRLRP